MKNILFIGGSGFIGRNIIHYMTKNFKGACNIFNLDSIVYENANSNYIMINGSISDILEIEKLIINKKIDLIIHFVSTMLPSSTLTDYIRDIDIVQKSTLQVLDICSRHEVKLVYFSSGGTIYGSQHGVHNEENASSPISFYGLSKLQTEELIQFYHRAFDLEYLIIRPSNPYGFGQNINGKQGLIAVLLGKILYNKTVQIFGDGNAVRDYIYIDDLAYYVSELVFSNISNQIINIGTGKGYSINEIIKIIESIANIEAKKEFLESRNFDVNKIILDVSKLNHYFCHDNIDINNGIKIFYNKLQGN